MSRVKQVTVLQGDTLRSIALRELGKTERWSELVTLNDLRLPYIVASYRAADHLPNTLIWGDTVLIPWEANGYRVPTPKLNFGQDVSLSGGVLVAVDGDLLTVEGRSNLIQALQHRIKTLRNELVYHPEYGCSVSLALGLGSSPFSNLMAAAWVQEALRNETRLQSVKSVTAEAVGDVINVTAQVMEVGNNSPFDFNLVLNP